MTYGKESGRERGLVAARRACTTPDVVMLSTQERACQTRGDVASFSVYCRTISGENSDLASGYNGLGDRGGSRDHGMFDQRTEWPWFIHDCCLA